MRSSRQQLSEQSQLTQRASTTRSTIKRQKSSGLRDASMLQAQMQQGQGL